MNILRTAGPTLGWVFARDRHMTVWAIPYRDAMSPPQLPADAPVLDVFEPVEIGLLKAFGHNLDASISHCCKRGFCQWFDCHKPLRGDHRLDDFATAL